MKRYILLISFVLIGLLCYLLGYLRGRSFVLNYYDTFYVIDKSSFNYFIFYLFSIPTLFYFIFRKHFKLNIALLHIVFKSISIFLYLLVDFLQQNRLPKRYFFENYWYENENIQIIILYSFLIGIGAFLLNIFLSIAHLIKSLKR